MTPSPSTEPLPDTAAAATEELARAARAARRGARRARHPREHDRGARAPRADAARGAASRARRRLRREEREGARPRRRSTSWRTSRVRTGERATRTLTRPPTPLADEDAAPSPNDARAPRPKRVPRRRPLPPELPRVREVHELSDEERQCPCGCTLTEIGEETSERIDIIPARIQVVECVRKKYACRGCEERVCTAPVPLPRPLPRSCRSRC